MESINTNRNPIHTEQMFALTAFGLGPEKSNEGSPSLTTENISRIMYKEDFPRYDLFLFKMDEKEITVICQEIRDREGKAPALDSGRLNRLKEKIVTLHFEMQNEVKGEGPYNQYKIASVFFQSVVRHYSGVSNKN